MPSTALTVVEPGGYLALSEDPAEIEAIIAENLGGQEITERDLPLIKMPSGETLFWQVPSLGGVQAVDVIEGIVVHFKSTRALWDDSKKDEDNRRPICVSDNAIVGKGNPGGACKTCPMAQFGTATDDNGDPAPGQACNAKELWFILLPGSYLPVVVRISAGSLDNAKKYRVGTLGSAGMRLGSVVTRIGLEPDKNAKGDSYSKAVPSVAGALSPEEMAKAKAYAQKLRPIFDAAAEAINVEDETTGAAA